MTAITKVGTEFLANSEAASGWSDPSVTSLANGGFVVTWADFGGTNPGGDTQQGFFNSAIKAQVFGADGAKLGTELQVSRAAHGIIAQPTTVGLAGGGFAISWQDYGDLSGSNAANGLKSQVFTADGAKVGGEFLISSGGSSPTMTALASGALVVAWNEESRRPDGAFERAIEVQQLSLIPTVTMPGNGGGAIAAISGYENTAAVAAFKAADAGPGSF